MARRKKSSLKKILFAGATAVCLFLVFYFSSGTDGNERYVAHSNPIDFGLSLSLERDTNKSATETNPEFKNISFAPIKEKPMGLGQAASIFDAVKNLAFGFFDKKEAENQPKEYGTWIWTPVLDMTPKYMDSVISAANKNGIDAVYVSIDSYLDIFSMKNGAGKKAKEKLFAEKLNYFISQAKKRGISVDAEGGWRNWAEDGNQYKAFVVVSYVKKFNESHSNKFRGFQYDVEPYLLDSFKENPEIVLKNFTTLIDQTENFLSDSDIKFSVVVPDFYDGKDGVTPKFSYSEKKDYVFGHLLNILSNRPDNSIIVMSYRNFADGKDGSIEITRNEIKTAGKKSRGVKIIVAQEIGNVPPPYITFHNTSKSRLLSEVEKIKNAFNSSPNFGGVAYHYVNALMALK